MIGTRWTMKLHMILISHPAAIVLFRLQPPSENKDNKKKGGWALGSLVL